MFKLEPQKGKQELAMNVVDSKGRIPTVTIYGGGAGSGKSIVLLLKAALFGYQDPNFNGIIFRRTTGPLRKGLYPTAKSMFQQLNPRFRNKDMEIIFESTGGGVINFTHMEHVHDAEGNHQGLEYSFVGFDEL